MTKVVGVFINENQFLASLDLLKCISFIISSSRYQDNGHILIGWDREHIMAYEPIIKSENSTGLCVGIKWS